MKKGYKGVPVAAARAIAKQFDKDQVIIVTWDKTFGKMHVTTYGKTVAETMKIKKKVKKVFLDVKVGDKVRDCDPRTAGVRREKSVIRVGPKYITVQSMAATSMVRLDRLHDKPNKKSGYYLVPRATENQPEVPAPAPKAPVSEPPPNEG